MKKYIAVDLGAESGRVIIGTVADEKITLEEIHRFPNGPVERDGSLHWDFKTLFANITTGIQKAVKKEKNISGIGVDSWGVDFGLIGKNGELIEEPFHYRDSRTDGMLEKAFSIMPKREVYENTGLQFMQLNSLYQLLSLKLNRPEILKQVSHITFMADLVSYHLSGELFAEYSLASTSQLMDMRSGKWSKNIFKAFDLPMGIMPKVVSTGSVVGKLTEKFAKQINAERIAVIAVGSHDTASAVAAVPAKQKNWAYLSSGTWSLMGVEIPKAVINDDSYDIQFTNEGGVCNTIRFLKNIMGLWIVQQCRQQWKKEGDDLSYEEITKLATNAKPFAGYINPNDNLFLAPGDMTPRINKYMEKTGQKKVEDKGQIVRIVLESLALNYRWCLEKIEEITQNKIDVLHVVGGGTKNELLCQFTADAIGRVVSAGPVEATATGNILVQAIAAGQIDSLEKGRAIVSNSFTPKHYSPSDTQAWDKQYQKIGKIFNA